MATKKKSSKKGLASAGKKNQSSKEMRQVIKEEGRRTSIE
jgi:hypothetical protein